MTMHAVLGDGGMTRRELTETLGDLWKADEESGQTFWFLLQGKSEPTDTDQALVTWLEKNEIYYQLVTDDPDAVSEIYAQAQEVHTAKKIVQKVVALLQSVPDEDEPAEILALFVDNDPNAPEDRWLNSVIEAARDAGFATRALNDGLVEVDLSEGAAALEVEPDPVPKPAPAPAKRTAKKLAARPAAGIPVPAEDDAEPQPAAPAAAMAVPTREDLEDMEPSEVKEVAAALGIVLPPRTRVTTYIDHILGEAKAAAPTAEISEIPEVAFTEVASNGNGHIDPAVVAEQVVDLLFERIQKLLINN